MKNYFLPEENEIKSKINLVLYFTILGYIVSLFFKDAPVVSNIFIIFIFLSSFFSPSSYNLKERFIRNRINIGITLFYLFQVLSVFLSENIRDGLAILLLRAPLLLLPLSFCFIEFDKKIWSKILLFYALTTVFASVIGFIYGVYRTLIENDTGNLYNDNISYIIGKQAVYFAFYVGVAIMIFVIQIKEYPSIVQKYRILIYLAVAWLLFIIFMLASRTAMFGLLLILSIYVIKACIDKRKFFELLLFFSSLIIGSVIITKSFPKILNRFKGTTDLSFQYNNKNVENHFNEEYDQSKWNGTSTRAAIWSSAFEIWRTKPILGTGLGDRNVSLMKKYEENQFWYGLATQKNTHNQYLDVLLSMGIVGLILFVVVLFIYPIQLFLKQKQGFSIGVYALLAICFITENMLDRYQGLVFIGFILPLVSKIVDRSNAVIPK